MSEATRLPTFSKDGFDVVVKHFVEMDKRAQRGEQLTDDEQRWYEFVEEKINDWKTDALL